MPRGSGPCRPCEMFWGALGIGAGLILLYMGADLLAGGALTAAISGRPDGAPTEEADGYDR